MTKRIVFDTNILVSAILTKSEASLIVDWAIRHATILASTGTIQEVKDVIMRSKFDNYISRENRTLALEHIKSCVTWVHLENYPQLEHSYCRDPKDDIFFQLALAGRADWLISRDKDILEADPVDGVCVFTAKQALEKNQG